MNKPLTEAELLRVGHVVRWSIVRTSRPQTVAEHTTLVMLLALIITERIGADVDSGELLMFALFHDIAEVRLGDMPTPTKAALREKCGFDPLKELEQSIAPDATHDPLIHAIVKLADIVEAYQFLDVEGVGSHAAQVKGKMAKAFRDKLAACIVQWPKYDWQALDGEHFASPDGGMLTLHTSDYE